MVERFGLLMASSVSNDERAALQVTAQHVKDKFEYIDTLKERGNVVLELVKINRRVERLIDRLIERY